MSYPKDIPAVRAALLAFALPPAPEEGDDPFAATRPALEAALPVVSPVVQIVQVFDALKPVVAALDPAGLNLLAGCAHLIAVNAWFGRGEEALDARDAAAAAMSA